MSRDSDAMLEHPPRSNFAMEPTGKPAVLIVDDEPQLVTAIGDALDEQYRVVGETSPRNALEILRSDPGIHVIISDQRMPLMTGDEFLFHAQQVSSATRILITAYADLNAVIHAVNRGKIFSYIRKPWHEAELRSSVDAAAQHYALGTVLSQERALLKSIMDCNNDLARLEEKRLDRKASGAELLEHGMDFGPDRSW
jgi:two-component system cell cycle sensor histidine kinase PleC